MKHKRGEKTTKMKKDILKSDDAFLLEKDLQELEKLAHQKSKHIHIINELDEKIVLVQNSTRTLIPQLSPLHNYLRQKSPWYYKWHLKPFAKFVHWFALLLYLTALPFLILHITQPAPAVKASGYLFSRWQWSNPKIPIGRINQAVSCLDNESYWVAEDYGVILRSEDKGVKWDQEYTGAEGKDINGLVCISKTNIIAVGDSGLILQYSGLYDSWTERASNTSANITKVEYLGDNNLIALTDTTEVVTSSDSGATWSTSGANLTFTPVNITALSSTSAIVIGNGKIAATRDAGKSWVYPASQPSENFRSITKVNSETAIAVGPITGDHSHIIKITLTDTSFSSEEKQEVPAGIFMNSVSALNESNIIAVGSDNNSSFGKTYASLNGGDTWSELTTSEFLQPKQVIGLDANNAIVCGFLSCEKWTYNNG